MSPTPPLFRSGFSDTANPLQFQPSDWNRVSDLLTELLGSGPSGGFLTRDTDAADGTAWSSSAALLDGSPSFAGPLLVGSALAAYGTNPVIPDAIEETLIMEGDTCHTWYKKVSTSRIHYAYSTDPLHQTWTDGNGGQPVIPPATGYPSVFVVGSTYYMLTQYTGSNLYLWSSTDKVTWALANNGNPVFTHSAVNASWFFQVINAAVVVVGSTLHLVCEGKDNLGNNFAIGYAWSTLAEGPNFNNHISSAAIFSGVSGNPAMVYVPDRNALLVIAGAIPNVTWELRAWSASLGSDLTLAASWTQAPGFGMQTSGVHLTDPSFVFTTSTTKPWRTMLAYNYAQLDGWRAYGHLGLTEFYDLVTDPDSSQSLQVGGTVQADFFSVGPYTDVGVSRISSGVLGVGTGALGSVAGTVRAALFDGYYQRPAGTAANPGDYFATATTTGFYLNSGSIGWTIAGVAKGSLGTSGVAAIGYGIFGSTSAIGGGINLSASGEVQFGSARAMLGTAPTLGTGWGSGAALATGAKHFSFEVTLGTSPSATMVLNLPNAPHLWCGSFDNLTNPASRVYTSARTINTITITSSAGFTASDVIAGICFPY